MRPLSIDFQRPLLGRRLAGWLLLMISLCLIMLGLDQHASLLEEEAHLTRQLSPSHDRTSRPLAAQSRPTTRYEALFSRLEAAHGTDITLLSLQPGNEEIRLSGEAINQTALLAWLQRLHSDRLFADSYLADSEMIDSHAQHPVHFTIRAFWPTGEP